MWADAAGPPTLNVKSVPKPNKPNEYANHLFYCYRNIYQIIIIYENYQMYSLPIKKEEVELEMVDLKFDESFDPKESFFTPTNTPFD